MDSPLQLLRDILPFGQHSAEQKSAAAIRGLLDTIAGLSPHETIAKLASSVLPTVGRQTNLHMRFKLLEDVRFEAEQALPTLESEITIAVLPLPMEAATAALNADNLLKTMAYLYSRIAQDIRKSQLAEALGHLYYRCIQRAIAMVARRQLLAYRAYAMPSSSSWEMLHQLYQMARGSLETPLNGDTAPIEHEYLGALLFAFLEPGRLPRADLEAINICSRQLAAYAVISSATLENLPDKASGSWFLVSPDEGHPGFPMVRLPAGTSIHGSFLIDCSQVLAALDRNITRRPGKNVEPDLDTTPALMQCMRVAIGGKSTRRFSRTHFRPRGDLVSGLDQVMNFLDGNAFSRRSGDHASRYTGKNFQTTEWALMDESPDGFRLRFIKGNRGRLASGDIVALQPREVSKIHVGLVRRISSSHFRLELGMQLISHQVLVVDLMTDAHGEQRAIFLQSLPTYGKASGLIVPPSTCTMGQRVTIRLPGRTLQRQIGTCIEANDGLEFFALEQYSD